MAFTAKTETPDIIDRWPYDFQRITPDDDHYEYLGAFATELRRIDVFIDELYEQRYAESATNDELRKLGAEVGIAKRDTETEDEFRYRVRLGKAIAASDGTADEIASILSTAFGEDNIGDITVEHDPGHPVTRFEIPSAYIDDIPLTLSEFEEELERAFPCGHGVTAITTDTFRLGESGSQGLGNGELL